MSDCELCHSTSKPIGDEEDILKSFMTFDITSREPVFRVVVRNQIVVPLTMTYIVCLKTNLFSSPKVFAITQKKKKKSKSFQFNINQACDKLKKNE